MQSRKLFDFSKDTEKWLLEESNPSVRYFTMRKLLEYPENSAEVQEAKHAIMREGHVPKILSNLNDQGHYVDPKTISKYGRKFAAFGYIPKYKATIWQVILFAEFGVDPNNIKVRRACEYVLEHCFRNDGLVSMHGMDTLTPCLQGNMLWALSVLGFSKEAKFKKAVELMIKYTRFDDGGFRTPKEWPYRGKRDRCSDSHSCYAGCIRSLRAALALPKRRDDKTNDFISRGVEYFLKHRVYKASRNPNKLLHKGIDVIVFPVFIFGDFLENLDVLLDAGVRDDRMNDAIALLLSKRQRNGRWLLERDVSNLHIRLERKGFESKWATLRALKALKKCDSLDK